MQQSSQLTTYLVFFVLIAFIAFAIWLWIRITKTAFAVTKKDPSAVTVKNKIGIPEIILFTGGLLFASPFLSIILIGLIITPLFKTDSDLGFGVSMFLLMGAAPAGIFLMILGALLSIIRKRSISPENTPIEIVQENFTKTPQENP